MAPAVPERPAAFAPDGGAPGPDDARTIVAKASAALDTWRAAQTALAAIDGAAADARVAGTPGAVGAVATAVARAAATAVAAYDRFGAAVPALADQAALGRAEALDQGGDAAGAVVAYGTAAALAGDPATAVIAHIRVGNARLADGDPAAAAAAYDAALTVAADDGSRAQAMAGLVAASLDLGYVDAAMAVRLRLVRELPGMPPAAVALERLREAGVAVTVAEEAAVYRAQGDAAQADALLAAAGITPPADEAAWQRARDEEAAGRDEAARSAYTAFAERFPDAPRVAEAHWRRAWLALAAGDDGAAIPALDALVRQRPDDARAGDAAVLAGVLAWQAGRGDEADARFTAAADIAERAGRGADAARAQLWLAKTADDGATRHTHAMAAITLDPLGDAAARARDLVDADDATPANVSDDAATVAWLARWTDGADVSGWSAAHERAARRPGVVRGAAWLGLGERTRALAAWRAAVREADAPGDRLAVALLAHDLGLLTIASSAAEQVLTRAPAADRAGAPAAVLRLAYPLGWPAEVAASAAEHGVPASLLAALVRQESRWDPAAVSGAGARGLTQIMPATGHGIAGSLGVPGFEAARLDEPALALRFGAQYLGVQWRRFDGRDAVALAAYNAGPGNAAEWWAAAGGDIDAFLARIAFPETRRYVRGVIAAEAVYRRLGTRRPIRP